MNSLFSNFLSNRAVFFDLFDKAIKNVVEMATLLLSEVKSDNDVQREQIAKQIDKLENIGDDFTHKLYLCLDRIIFTPLNRNDIHTLAAAIDDVADTIKEASGRIYLYNIRECTPPVIEISNIIFKAVLEIEKAVNLLRTSKKSDDVLTICRRVKTFEKLSDQVYYNAVASLFATEKEAIELIKYREILLSLETSVKKCKYVADALNAVMVNNI